MTFAQKEKNCIIRQDEETKVRVPKGAENDLCIRDDWLILCWVVLLFFGCVMNLCFILYFC